MENPKNHRREIVVEATATSIEKWRKQVIAGQPETGRMFAFMSDEGNYIPGGEGTAPTPLTYFVSGMALWLISHVTQVASKKRLNLRKEIVKVTAHFREEGSVLRGDAMAFCDGFEVEIQIESDEPLSTIRELVRLARQMCFTEVALTNNTPITVTAKLNGNPLERD